MRKQRIALIDPIHGVAYWRAARKGCAGIYHEDSEIQAVLNKKGLAAARLFASRHYQGVFVAVLVD